MYIFVFYWSAAMKSAHDLSHPPDTASSSSSPESETHIPFGVIFATFMAAMMLGSLLFSHLSSRPPSSLSSPTYLSLTGLKTTPSTLLTVSILLASSALLLPTLVRSPSSSETLTFWSYCIFELCIGIYFPSMSAQKSRIVADGVRASIYGVLRIPLNVFVVVALTTTVEGREHRDKVFVICGGLLLGAAAGAGWWLEDEDVGSDGGSEVGEMEERIE
jgi:MFS transporter, MFS domain-containing protein family, molybdate-anion transporter